MREARRGRRTQVITGPHAVLLTASRGTVRAHTMPVKGGVLGLTPFHNANCPFGFIYAAGHGALQFAQLPAKVSYGTAWPVRRVLMRCTVHGAVYLPEAKCYVLASSHPTPARARTVEAGDRHAGMANAAATAAAAAADGREETYEIRLLSPGGWAVEWRTVLEPGEMALCVKAVTLKVGQGSHPQRPFVAVGTAFLGGEDVPTRGRILLLECTRQQTGSGAPQYSGRVVHAYEYNGAQRGPVTAVAGMEGHLIVAIGNKVSER